MDASISVILDEKIRKLEREIRVIVENLNDNNSNLRDTINSLQTQQEKQIDTNQTVSNALSDISSKLSDLLGNKSVEENGRQEERINGEDNCKGNSAVNTDHEEEREDYISAEEDNSEPSLPKKSALKTNGSPQFSQSASKISAYRFGPSLIGTVPTGNLEGWLIDGFCKLGGAFPGLEDSDLIDVICSALPNDIRDSIRANAIKEKQSFIRHVVAIENQCSGGQDECLKRFYAYNPRNKRLRQVAAELSQLSHHIGLTDIDRRRVLNQRLVNIMPKTAHKLSLKHRLSQIGEGSDALELLHVVFSDKELLDEVEREWLSRPQQKIHQANFVDSSENNGEKNKKEKYNNGRKKVRRDRCKKCGLIRHSTNDCNLYADLSEVFCNICKQITGYEHFHHESRCRNAPWVQNETGSGSKN